MLVVVVVVEFSILIAKPNPLRTSKTVSFVDASVKIGSPNWRQGQMIDYIFRKISPLAPFLLFFPQLETLVVNGIAFRAVITTTIQ